MEISDKFRDMPPKEKGKVIADWLRILIEEMREDRRRYLLLRRQTLIMELGHIEDELGMGRSIIPRHKRKKEEQQSTGDEVV